MKLICRNVSERLTCICIIIIIVVPLISICGSSSFRLLPNLKKTSDEFYFTVKVTTFSGIDIGGSNSGSEEREDGSSRCTGEVASGDDND